MISDILVSWRQFLDQLQSKYGHTNATMVLHTDPMDQEGTNLYEVINILSLRENIVFSKDRIGFNEMNILYNACDTIINRSCNEGFGLPTLEMAMCGKPVIAIKTGGLSRQVEDPDTGEEVGIGMEPEVRTMVGNHMVPYIYEDFVSHKTTADAFMKMFELGPEGREELGKKAMARVKKEYSLEKVVSEWDRTLSQTIEKWQTKKNPRWKAIEL